VLLGIVVAAVTVGAVAAAWEYRTKYSAKHAEEQWASLKGYCTECHSAAEAAGNVVFEGVPASAIGDKTKTFEAAIRKLRGGLMPPPGNPRPDQKDIDAFVAWAEHAIDDGGHAAAAGHVPVQRLNRPQYAATVADLLGVDIDTTQYLPTEVEVDGFTNIAAALSVSPAFLDQYIGLARTVAHLAVGEPNPKLASVYFAPPTDDQDSYVDGLPLGTRGGTRFTHTFPADGEYRFTIGDILEGGLYPGRTLETPQTLVVLLDRDEVFRAKLGGEEDLALVDHEGAPGRAQIMQRFAAIPVKVTAGVHEIVITFIERGRVATDEPIYGFTPYGGFSFRGQMRVPRLQSVVEVKGPFDPTGVSRTASREKIFICTPGTPAEERPCAERITANLARRAFRRPVEQADVDRLMPFYDAGRVGGFDAGVEQMVTAVLASPDFLYRAIMPPHGGADGAFALSDVELASRLSFFLWSQGPDDELLELAAADKLHDGAALEKQVRRMLADPRAGTLVTNFALKWLNLDELDAVDPDTRLFPEFNEELRADFATEIDEFLRSVLLEDKDVRELLSADYTFLNERLARHYGITSVRGPQFRRVTLENPARFGLLGKGAALLRTSYGDRTSPVLRGAWVLDKLMGTPPTPPPADVVTDLTTPAGEKPKTLRARLETHRAAPNCKACHGVIDPYGLSLENFTVTGQWRDVDKQADAPIDAHTELSNGTALNGPIELRETLLARSDQFVQAMTIKLMMYGLGRELGYEDMPQVRAVVHSAAKQDYRFAALVEGIVSSDAFRLQAPRESAPAQTVASTEK
jgi:mono/diheme cytochrome c family protein